MPIKLGAHPCLAVFILSSLSFGPYTSTDKCHLPLDTSDLGFEFIIMGRSSQSVALLTALSAVVTQVAAHGHVSNIIINGLNYEGWDINSDPYKANPPTKIAWQTPNTNNGFITPDQYDSPDIICHESAQNANAHAVVAAGDKILLQWTPWPSSHHGPVLGYLANCNGPCETVDKTTLEFFKIDAVGLVDESNPPGIWGDDELIANNNAWLLEIPPSIAPGNYVLRNELIALHGASSKGGAQNYPQCFNLHITGGGSDQPSGVLGTELYTPTDPGILVDIYQSIDYQIPGPSLVPGAVIPPQASSTATASGTPITAGGSPGGNNGGGGGGSTPTPTTTTTTPVQTPTMTTTTKTTPPPNNGGGGGATQTVWGQCGGKGWTGATACGSEAHCTSYNPYYYQCVPTGM